MPIAIQLPALSPTMAEGRITKWLKKEGDKIAAGDGLAECETDKSNLEIEANDAGVLLKIVVPAGSSAPVGGVIGWVGKAGEAIPEGDAPAGNEQAQGAPAQAEPEQDASAQPEGEEAPEAEDQKKAAAPPTQGKEAPEAEDPKKATAPPTQGKAVAPQPAQAKTPPQPAQPKTAAPPAQAKTTSKPAQPQPAATQAKVAQPHAASTQGGKAVAPASSPEKATESGERLRASPLARKMAETQGISLTSVPGSGPNGRIVKRDVEQAMESPAEGKFVRASPGVRQPPEDLPLSSMRKVIATRLSEVKPGVPHFYLTIDVEMDQALKLRDEAKAEELKISVNDVLVKATAMAVRKFPRINQVFAGDRIVQLKTVDVGVAVAIEDGLITPIVKDADVKGIAEIAHEIRELAERAKKRALKPDEYTGGSITVSNLGMYGIDSFIAVLNPPQAAILAVGKVEPKVVVRNDEMVIRQMMSITLSGDHRVIDGAVGAQYLKELRSLLEHPLRLAL